MQIIQRAFLYLFCICLMACSFTPDELKIAEPLIETAPDSALHILQHIPVSKLRTDRNRALYGLLMFETLGKKKLPMKPDSLIDFAIVYYSNHPDGNRLASCLLYKGRSYKYIAQYEKAMLYYLKALDEIKDQNDNILSGRLNFDMGDILNIQCDYKLAREKYGKASICFNRAKFQAQSFYSLLNIGRTYHEEKNYKIAMAYYQKLIVKTKDSLQTGALYQEIGLNFYNFNSLDSALIYFRKVLDYPYLSNNKALRYLRISKLFFQKEKIDSSLYYAQKSFDYEPDIRTQREAYCVISNCEFIRGNTKNVTIYMNKYVALGDSIRKIDTQIKGSYMETMHKAKKEAAQSKNLVWYLSCLVLLVLVGSYLYYILYSRRTKKEKVELHQTVSVEKTEKLIKFIDDKAAILHLKIDERKLAVLSEYKTASIQERENQIRKIYDDLLHINDTNFFLKDMDTDLNNLVTKLQNRYNGLNEKQLIWCCLHLLRISNYDMLIIFNYKNDNSLKGLKKRLMKKFNLDSVTLFHDFLIAILSEN
ncbi:MAG: tetratricopeptide repeat protein [Bacteroidia bacterium]